MAIIESIYIFFSVASNYRYMRVFKLLVYLGIRAYLAVLPRGLYYYNFLLLEGPSYFKAMAFYRVFIKFSFISSRSFKEGMVDINKRYK